MQYVDLPSDLCFQEKQRYFTKFLIEIDIPSVSVLEPERECQGSCHLSFQKTELFPFDHTEKNMEPFRNMLGKGALPIVSACFIKMEQLIAVVPADPYVFFVLIYM